MKSLIGFRNKIEQFVRAHYTVSAYLVRLVVAALCLFILRDNIGYNEVLSNVWVIIVLSIACAFIPIRLMSLMLLAYVAIQLFSLSAGVAVTGVAILAIMYLIYFRFSGRYAYLIILVPVLSMIRLQLLAPLLLAVIAPLSSIVPIVFGTIVYYMLHYITVNATVFSESANMTEQTKVSFFLEGTFIGKEFLYTLAVTVIVFMIVYHVRRTLITRSKDIAVGIGTGSYIILMLAANLVFGTITSAKIITIVVSAIAAAVIAEFLHSVFLPLDYLRTEQLQFEDREYYYYVRAVPKAAIEKETVRINSINTRKRKSNERSKE